MQNLSSVYFVNQSLHVSVIFVGNHQNQWRTRGGGGFWGFKPPRNSEGPPKSCQTQPILKIADFRTPTPQDVRQKGSKILRLPPVRNCFTWAMTNKLVVIINSLKVPKIKKILSYEMKYLVPNIVSQPLHVSGMFVAHHQEVYCTRLFKMIVGVLTTCHTQYTWDSSICIFYLIEQHTKFFVTYLTGALYVHPLWFYKHQHDNRVRSKLFIACQRWWFQWRFWFVPSVPGYTHTYTHCLLKLFIPPSNGIVRLWFFPEFGAEFPLDICTPTIILNNPVYIQRLVRVVFHISKPSSSDPLAVHSTEHSLYNKNGWFLNLWGVATLFLLSKGTWSDVW